MFTYRPQILQKITIALGLVALVFLSACAPRGESKSLDEVYQISRARYLKVKNVMAPEPVQPLLTKLVDNLEAVNSNKALDSEVVAASLADLTEHASYTNRPAFAELAAQYRALTETKDPGTSAGVKLLASRTYSLIASELETVKFTL